MSRFQQQIIPWCPVVTPLLGLALGWWFWTTAKEKPVITPWRRIASLCALILVTASVGFGAFAVIYWDLHPHSSPGPPPPTYVATMIGFWGAVAAVPISLCAMSRTRISLVASWRGLLGFYFLLFLSP
jgi:hypothetical protein